MDLEPISGQSPKEPPVNEEYKIDKPGINWRANWPGGRRRIPEDDPDYERWRSRKKIERENFRKTVGEFQDDIDAAAKVCNINEDEVLALQIKIDEAKFKEEREKFKAEFNELTAPVYYLLRSEKYGYEIIELNS